MAFKGISAAGWLASRPRLCSVGGWNPSAHAGQPPRLLSLSPLRFCLRSIWNRLFIGRNVGTQMHPRGRSRPCPAAPFPFRSPGVHGPACSLVGTAGRCRGGGTGRVCPHAGAAAVGTPAPGPWSLLATLQPDFQVSLKSQNRGLRDGDGRLCCVTRSGCGTRVPGAPRAPPAVLRD